MKTAELFKNRLRQSETTTKWMEFYVLWLLPVTLVLCGLFIIVCSVIFICGLMAEGFGIYAVVFLFAILGTIPVTVLKSFTLYFCIRLFPIGFKLLVASCIVELVVCSIFLVLQYRFVMTYLIYRIPEFLGIILSIANLYYFAKRKHLFAPMEQTVFDESM